MLTSASLSAHTNSKCLIKSLVEACEGGEESGLQEKHRQLCLGLVDSHSRHLCIQVSGGPVYFHSVEEMLSLQIQYVSDHSWDGARPLSRAEREFLVTVVQIGGECNRIQSEGPYDHRTM